MDNEKYTLDKQETGSFDGVISPPSEVPVNSFKCISMMTSTLRFAKTKFVKTPERGTEYSAGLDFFIPNDWNDNSEYIIQPQQKVIIPMGIHIDLLGSGLGRYMLKFENKSGIATKKGLVVGACVIDADYQGELMVHIYNASDIPASIDPGQKIIQGILIEVLYAEPAELCLDDLYLTNSSRGAGRFGSTGIK